MEFSTKDNDNDQWSGGSHLLHGGIMVAISLLNGLYGVDGARGIHWDSWQDYSLPFAEMKLRHI